MEKKVSIVKGVSPERAVILRKAEGRSLYSFGLLAGELDFDAMNCISPICLRIGRALQFVPCNKCNFCLANRRADWSFRLHQEWKSCKSADFLTMTYNEQEVPWSDVGQSLCKRDVQLFTKQLRNCNNAYLLDRPWPSVRYYTVGEYGTDTVRPHYHSIMFNLTRDTISKVNGLWKKGHVEVGSVTGASIHYVTGYVVNRVGDWEGRQKPFALISNRSGGLGTSYAIQNREWHRGDVLKPYVMHDGFKQRMPRIIKDKIFTAREKDRLGKELFDALGESERAEIDELSKFHPDPRAYVYERLVQAYNKLGESNYKSNAL